MSSETNNEELPVAKRRLVQFVDEQSCAVADNAIEEWYQQNKNTCVLSISTQLQLLRLRVAVKEKEIEPFDLKIGNNTYKPNKGGNFSREVWQQIRVAEDLFTRLIY